MRISDWSSDVCSSDLDPGRQADRSRYILADRVRGHDVAEAVRQHRQPEKAFVDRVDLHHIGVIGDDRVEASIEVGIQFIIARSELDSVAFDPIAHLEDRVAHTDVQRSEEHTSELQSLMRISYAV